MKKKRVKNGDGRWRNLVVFDNARPNNKHEKKKNSERQKTHDSAFMDVIYYMHFLQNII